MENLKVSIGGKERSLRFGYLSFGIMSEAIASSPIQDLVMQTAAIVYAGLENYNRIFKGEIDYSFDDVVGWVDELYCSDEGKNLLLEIDNYLVRSNMYKSVLVPLLEKLKAVSEEKNVNSVEAK